MSQSSRRNGSMIEGVAQMMSAVRNNMPLLLSMSEREAKAWVASKADKIADGASDGPRLYVKGRRIGAAQTRDNAIARLPEIQLASPDEAAAIITAIAKDVRDGKHDAPT